MVVPVFLYNSCTWAAPKNIFEKLDSAHRKHLREILNIRWPEMISNETLYARCKLSNLSCRVTKYRWTMLGNETFFQLKQRLTFAPAYCFLVSIFPWFVPVLSSKYLPSCQKSDYSIIV